MRGEAGLRVERPELTQHAEVVADGPVLLDHSVGDAPDVHVSHRVRPAVAREDEAEGAKLLVEGPRHGHDRDDEVSLRDEQVDDVRVARRTSNRRRESLEVVEADAPGDVVDEIRRQIAPDGVCSSPVENVRRKAANEFLVRFELAQDGPR